jgi:hypothetical protein
MQKQVVILALVCVGVACQPQTTSTTAVVMKDAKALPDSSATVAPSRAISPAFSTLAILRQHDLAALWSDPHGTYQENPVLDGFLGNEHRRFALAISAAHREAKQPQLFRVVGKSRLNGVTTPFAGTITIVSITDLADDNVAPGEAADTTNRLYTAKGLCQFQQVASPVASNIKGEVYFDFMIDRRGKVDMITTIMTDPNNKFPVRGCGMVLRGQRTNQATGKQKPVLLARDVFVIAPEVFADFGVGDRGTLVNPKYAKLGWNEAWENNEWWADSPKPKLNL